MKKRRGSLLGNRLDVVFETLLLTSNTTQLSLIDYNQTLHIDKTQKNIEPLFFYFSETRFLGIETTPIKPQAN